MIKRADDHMAPAFLERIGLGDMSDRFADRHNSIWALSSQAVSRGLVAAKFFIAAAFLGPAAIGQLGVAILVIAIVDALTDTGLQQAIVQQRDDLTPQQRGAAWKLLCLRGLAITAALFVSAEPIAASLSSPASAVLIQIAALQPLLRNSYNLGLFRLTRYREFRSIAAYEMVAAVLDFAVTIGCLKAGLGAESVLLGTAAAETFKTSLSWLFLREPQSYRGGFSPVATLISYGKWIWLANVAAVVLNQIDKVLVVKLIGEAELGSYQLATKLVQLIMVDWATAYSTYLFPTLARQYHDDPSRARTSFRQSFIRLLTINAALALCIVATAMVWRAAMPHSAWAPSATIMIALVFPGYLGACLVTLTSFCRAVALPQAVTYSMAAQISVFGFCAWLLVPSLGAVGAALSNGFGGAAAALSIILLAKRFIR